MNTTPKVRACAYDKCKREFLPARPMQAVCGPLCAKRLVKAKEDAKKAAEKAQTKARRMALETIPELIKAAQREYNAFVRERDQAANHPCVSCGCVLDWSGNGVDAGHWRSVGSASHLRFDERNCHAQCKWCNRHLAGNAVAYRAGLIRRLGIETVEAVEADNTPHKWTRDELRSIAALYRAKVKELLKEQSE